MLRFDAGPIFTYQVKWGLLFTVFPVDKRFAGRLLAVKWPRPSAPWRRLLALAKDERTANPSVPWRRLLDLFKHERTANPDAPWGCRSSSSSTIEPPTPAPHGGPRQPSQVEANEPPHRSNEDR
jgi:hypothetical protein